MAIMAGKRNSGYANQSGYKSFAKAVVIHRSDGRSAYHIG